ncbi:MAG: (deoxy)nucleoside triphosphate pyrophosphohydrolase [Clostridia bacterium]|nr:(deoxy)nucleoside triphosphate pyrophosphohydrolase [Clostridia bacterium]
MIAVVAAVIRQGDSVLIAQRPAGGQLAGRWEFPGGKIEKGESPEQALSRELREELDIEARAEQILCALTTVHPDGRDILILFYEARIVSGQPRPVEEAQTRFVPVADLGSYDLCEADRAFAGRCLI